MRPRLFTCILVVTLLAAGQLAQPQTVSPPADTPVGHWVAEHPSDGGIGSWWDFRSDGTLTHYIGAIVTSPITRSGDTFTSSSTLTYGSPITVRYHIDGDTLHLTSPNAPDQTLTRVGAPPSATDPLLGRWKLNAPAKPSTDRTIAAQQRIMTNAILIFSPDNTESVRVPFDSSEGNWDASTHTFHMQNQNGNFSFERSGAKLVLGQPPDNHKTDTYLPDPIQ
jgi:hypothetical protein